MHENKVFNFDNLKIVLSAIAGSIIGLITTIAIDTTLAEISLNPFFSLVTLQLSGYKHSVFRYAVYWSRTSTVLKDK